MSIPAIRKAQLGDRPSIHEAHMRSIREVCIKDHGPEEVRGWGHRELGERWIQGIRDGLVWVVEHEGRIGGVACIAFPGDGRTAHIQALYLTPDVLGLGVGRDLLVTMLQEAGRRGVDEVTLDSTITARGFYERFGFTCVGPAARAPIGGWPVTSFPMRLALGGGASSGV